MVQLIFYAIPIIFLAIYIVYKEEIETFVSRSNICNDTDGRCYEVVKKFNKSTNASYLLADLNIFSMKLMRHLRDKYIWSNSTNAEAVDIVKFLLSNYNPDGIIENAPTGDVNTSYVDNKGVVFAICLREKESGNNNFQHIHDLEFVVIHELSHMANRTYGHGADFWTTFKFLLREAEAANLHKPVDYSVNPIKYCSLEVEYSPYYDNTLNDLFVK